MYSVSPPSGESYPLLHHFYTDYNTMMILLLAIEMLSAFIDSFYIFPGLL